MPGLCYACQDYAEDEYHWYEGDVEVVWMLCEKCCEFAVSVVESISELDNEKERVKWTTWKN